MFIRLHLNQGDIICGNPNNEFFCKKIESIQLESLGDIQCCRKLIFFDKIKNKFTLAYVNFYLYNDNTNLAHITRSSQNETLKTSGSKAESFKH